MVDRTAKRGDGAPPAVDEHARIGANVRAARLRRGKSQDVVAGIAGHSKSWLSKVERGLAPLERRSDLAALAVALGVSPSELTGQPYDVGYDAVGSVARDSIPALRRALLDRPSAVARTPGQLRAGVDRLAELHQTGRAADAATLAASVIDALRASAGGPDHADVSQLTVLACYYSQSALQAMDRHDLAALVWVLMERSAAETDDPVTQALSAVAKSYGLAQVPVGAYAAALDVASVTADSIAGIGGAQATAAQGHLQLAAGFAAASLGEGAEALDRLRDAADHAARVDEPTLFAQHLGFGPVNVRLHEVAVSVELGQPERAVRASRGLTVAQAPTPERAACWLGDVGRAHAALGQEDQAVLAFTRAEKISPLRTRLHPLIKESVADMRDRRLRTAVGRELRGLAYRMGL